MKNKIKLYLPILVATLMLVSSFVVFTLNKDLLQTSIKGSKDTTYDFVPSDASLVSTTKDGDHTVVTYQTDFTYDQISNFYNNLKILNKKYLNCNLQYSVQSEDDNTSNIVTVKSCL